MCVCVCVGMAVASNFFRYRVIKTIASQRDLPTPPGAAVVVPSKQAPLPKLDLLYVLSVVMCLGYSAHGCWRRGVVHATGVSLMAGVTVRHLDALPTATHTPPSHPTHTYTYIHSFGVALPTEDQDYDPAGAINDALFAFLRTGAANPLRDIPLQWDSLSQARMVLEAAGSVDLEPLKLVAWDEMTSDFAITRWAFAGLGAHRLVRVPDSTNTSASYFVSDWTWLAGLEVRPGFERYGAAAYFNARGELTSITWSHGGDVVVRPGEKDWAHAKWAYKCSVIVGATLRDHLVGTHFLAANLRTWDGTACRAFCSALDRVGVVVCVKVAAPNGGCAGCAGCGGCAGCARVQGCKGCGCDPCAHVRMCAHVQVFLTFLTPLLLVTSSSSSPPRTNCPTRHQLQRLLLSSCRRVTLCDA